METLVLIILATGLGIFNYTNKPTQYELTMEDGRQIQVVLQKNNSYACPLYCEVDHIHQAIVCENEIQISNNQSVYHISEENEYGTAIYCSSMKILSMSRLTIKASKDKLPDVVSASTEE